MLSFQVAVLSDGFANSGLQLMLEGPGFSEPTIIHSTDSNSQVYTQELGFAGTGTAGNYTACEDKKHFVIIILKLF